MSKHLEATGDRVLRAYAKAAKRIQKDDCTKSSTSAGFIIPVGQPRGPKKGYQVFVTIVKYDEALLNDKPDSGGLLTSI